jgi:citrate lyase beta subunit
LDAYAEASARGVAAIDFEGQMVDEPLAAQARRVLALAEV